MAPAPIESRRLSPDAETRGLRREQSALRTVIYAFAYYRLMAPRYHTDMNQTFDAVVIPADRSGLRSTPTTRLSRQRHAQALRCGAPARQSLCLCCLLLMAAPRD